MNTSGTAIFIEPEGPLLEGLRERKRQLEQAMPGQPFCNHPPHCTVVFGRYAPPVHWLDALQRQLAPLATFELETDGWQEFPADSLAAGGHTVAYRVRPTKALVQLQRTVAECLAPFLTAGADDHPLAKTEPFAGSLRKFGLPFVGAHWIPHCTIGSPLVASGAPLLTQLMSGPVDHRFVVRTLSVWRVEGDRHERLHELALSAGQA